MLTRNISTEEMTAILKGKIPIFDAVFDFDRYGKAVFVHNKKYGVVNRNYDILLDELYDEIKILENGCIIAKYQGDYLLFDKNAYLIETKGFKTEEETMDYSEFF